jgi:VWFA-related protein
VTIKTRPADSGGVDIKLKLPKGTNLRLLSEKGNLEITGQAGNVLAKTRNGNIKLLLPELSNADLSLTSATGSVRSNRHLNGSEDSDHRSLYGKLGDGGYLLVAHSRHGDVTLSSEGGEQTVAGTEESDLDLDSSEESIRPVPQYGRPGQTDPPSRPSRPEIRRPNPKPDQAVSDSEPVKVDDNVLRIESQLVTLNASVSNGIGQPLLDLQKEDFQIFEDKIQQEVVHFQAVKAPFNLVLLIDLSGSVREKIKLIRRAAQRFVLATRPEDKVAIVTFSSSARIVSPLTNNREELKKRIERIDKPEGGTNFYDALDDTINFIFRSVRGERNAVVIMSDGVDNALPEVPGRGSEVTFEEVFERIQESDTIIFPIYLDTEAEAEDMFGSDISAGYSIARKQLQELADATGGTKFYARRVEDLEGCYEEVAAALRTIYSLGYYPSSSIKDGGFRRIQVRVSRNEAKVKTRRGYYTKK